MAKVIYSLSHWLSGPLRGRIDVSIAKTHRGSQNVPYKTALATFCLYFDEVHSRTTNQS